MIRLECQFCNSIIEVPKEWVIKNLRVFCGSCCKSFDVRIQLEPEQEEEEDKTPIYDGFEF